MNKKKSIIFINTPFQFLGVLEAINQLSLEEIELYAVLSGTENNRMQLKKLINEHRNKFSYIFAWDRKGHSSFINQIKCIYRIKNKKYENLFVGELGIMSNVIASNISVRKIYLVDDGILSLAEYNKAVNGIKKKRQFIREFRYMLFGLKVNYSHNINFFTFLDLRSNLNNSNVLTHDFQYFKLHYNLNKKAVNKCVYIIGDDVVEANMVSSNLYNAYIAEVKHKYKDFDIFYLMHRNESDLKKDILTKNKIEILRNIMPGEIFFALLSYEPEIIIGTFSTLLLSLKKIFPTIKVISYKFDNDLISSDKAEYENIYSFIDSNNIEIRTVDAAKCI